MSQVWNHLIELSNNIELLFHEYLKEYQNPKYHYQFDGWRDNFWNSDIIRKCHLKTIDNRDKKLWLMHINIFPHEGVDLPILGFDVVSGPNKITGSFFDFSPVIDHEHEMIKYFQIQTKDLTWKKPRDLPDWAKEIFSPHMIAAGNIQEEDEIKQLCDVSLNLIEYYLEKSKTNSYKTEYFTKNILNKYCINQKKNTHLHRSILAMGIEEKDKNDYVNNILFEEIN